MEETNKSTKGKIDWIITIVPVVIIVGLAILFFVFPENYFCA